MFSLTFTWSTFLFRLILHAKWIVGSNIDKTSSGNNVFENKFGKNLFLLKLFKLNLIPSSVNAVQAL